MAGKKKNQDTRKGDRKHDGKTGQQSQKEMRADARIRDAEKALSKALRDLESARDELTRREHNLTRLLAKHGRLPDDIEFNDGIDSATGDDSIPLLEHYPEAENAASESAGTSDDEELDVPLPYLGEAADPETFALFDQKQVIR